MSATETASTNLINLILTLLAPMFLWSTAGDIRLAHIAAAETLNEYRVTNRLSLWTVAKIIVFDIATLSSLSQSMYEDVSILLALRLRGNATSLDRSGERNRSRLEQENCAGTASEPIEATIAQAEQLGRDAEARMHAERLAADAPPPAAAPAADGPTPAARMPAEKPRAGWADAMIPVAEEFAAGRENVPPGEQWKEMARTTAAADLAAAPPPVPVMAAQ